MVQRAVAATRVWREAWVAAPLWAAGGEEVAAGQGTLEGIIDLMFEESDGGLVIVDYKTDAVAGRTLDEMAAPYLPQIGAYVYGVERVTGRTVREAYIVFARAEGERAYRVPDVRAAVAEATRAARAVLAGE